MTNQQTEKLTLSQKKRADIIDAAIVELRQNGFQAMNMDEVATRASVSKRTVYKHFASKELLFQEIVKLLLNQKNETTAIVYQADIDIAEQLTTYARNELKLLSSQQFLELSRVMIAECIYSPELVAGMFEQFVAQEQTLESWLSDAVADGKIKPVDPNYASKHFHGLLKAHAFWPQLLMGEGIPDKQLSEQVIADSVTMFVNFYQS